MKIEDMKGRKSVFHYNDDGSVRYISIEESDQPFFSERMKKALNMPAFLRHRFDEKPFQETMSDMAKKIREIQAKEPPGSYDPKDYEYLDIPEFLRRKPYE